MGVTHTTTAAEARAQLLAHVSTAPTNGETVLSTNTAVAVQTTSGHLASVIVEAYPSGARLRGGLNAAGDVWLATGGLLPSTTYQMTYKVDGANGVTAIGFGSFSTWPIPVIQMSEGGASPSTAASGPPETSASIYCCNPANSPPTQRKHGLRYLRAQVLRPPGTAGSGTAGSGTAGLGRRDWPYDCRRDADSQRPPPRLPA